MPKYRSRYRREKNIINCIIYKMDQKLCCHLVNIITNKITTKTGGRKTCDNQKLKDHVDSDTNRLNVHWTA
jgi:hypothetical protein